MVLAIFVLLLTVSVVAIGTLRGGSDLEAEVRAFQRTLELARSKTIASEGDARYGVYATSTSPQRYILFQGNDYASRQVSEDEVYELRDAIEFVEPAGFSGLSGQEVVFDRIQGTTSNIGYAVLRVKADPTNAKTVYVESSGAVEVDSSSVPSDDDRMKDSRHVHVTYSRGATPIDTATESVVLDFGTVTESISIQSSLSGGQIVWEDTVTVDGDPQNIKIHTHKLNASEGGNFVTEFSVHRDRRPEFNTKALTISLSGDLGSIIQYDAAGITTQGTSAYASAPMPQ